MDFQNPPASIVSVQAYSPGRSPRDEERFVKIATALGEPATDELGRAKPHTLGTLGQAIGLPGTNALGEFLKAFERRVFGTDKRDEDRLIDRGQGRRSVALTDAGRELARLLNARRAGPSAAADRVVRTGFLCATAPGIFQYDRVADFFRSKVQPGDRPVGVRTSPCPSRSAARAEVLSRAADFAVVWASSDDPVAADDLVSTELAEVDVVLVAADEAAFNKGWPDRSYFEGRSVFAPDGVRVPFDEAGVAVGRRGPLVRTGSGEAALEQVLAGGGVAALPAEYPLLEWYRGLARVVCSKAYEGQRLVAVTLPTPPAGLPPLLERLGGHVVQAGLQADARRRSARRSGASWLLSADRPHESIVDSVGNLPAPAVLKSINAVPGG